MTAPNTVFFMVNPPIPVNTGKDDEHGTIAMAKAQRGDIGKILVKSIVGTLCEEIPVDQFC
jgi:hypothetical protein